MITLGHDRITSCTGFMERLIERFDKKGLKLQFKKLVLLKQWSSSNTYIVDF